ncbi:MAG: DUF1778 domain-containing protein [Verrucomicrobiota bacterium]
MELTERLEARIDPHSKGVLKRAAEINRQSLSEFVVSTALKKAKRILEKEDSWQLSPEQSAEFVAALMADGEPNDKLKRAAERYKNSDLAK